VSAARRIIACLDVRAGRVVKGVRFRAHCDMGGILERALAYRDQGADEIVFYDITASPEQRSVDRTWVEAVGAELDIPFCVAGGITSVAAAEAVLAAGADKISLNTPALQHPELIDELAGRFGSQCVVVGVDSIERGGVYETRQMTGDPKRMQHGGRLTLDWLGEAQARGAGEIVLNCMNADGTRQGYDLAQLKRARAVLSIPLVASGGAGSVAHFIEAFAGADVDAALAAGVLHSGALDIPTIKQGLLAAGIAVRPAAGAVPDDE